MKKYLLLILSLIILPVSLIFGGCGSVKFKINLIVDNEVYSSISTSGNEAISMPKDPTKDGYIFDGWFWDNNTFSRPFTVNSILNEPLTNVMKVYAKWRKIPDPTLDQGIKLNLKNLDLRISNFAEPNKIAIIGEIHELNDAKDGMIELATSTEPGDVKYVVVPTIAAAEGSTSFYAKAKLVYTFNVYNADRSGFATIGGEGEDKDNVKEYTLADLYTDAENKTVATLADIFANGKGIEFAENWVKIDGKDYYVYSSTKTAKAPTAIAYAADATPVDIFAADDTITNTITPAVSAQKVSLKDWTDTTNPAEYVEFGGPNFYDANGNKLKLAQINVRLVIEVIQEAYTGVATDAGSALANWLAE